MCTTLSAHKQQSYRRLMHHISPALLHCSLALLQTTSGSKCLDSFRPTLHFGPTWTQGRRTLLCSDVALSKRGLQCKQRSKDRKSFSISAKALGVALLQNCLLDRKLNGHKAVESSANPSRFQRVSRLQYCSAGRMAFAAQTVRHICGDSFWRHTRLSDLDDFVKSPFVLQHKLFVP